MCYIDHTIGCTLPWPLYLCTVTFFWFGFNLKSACFDQTPKFKTMELAAAGIPNITFAETNI